MNSPIRRVQMIGLKVHKRRAAGRVSKRAGAVGLRVGSVCGAETGARDAALH